MELQTYPRTFTFPDFSITFHDFILARVCGIDLREMWLDVGINDPGWK